MTEEEHTQLNLERSLRRRYGVTPQWLFETWEKQGGSCALCPRPLERARSGYAVDHCHHSGRVRGLLCVACNTQLGVVEKNLHRLDRMLAYARGE